jgi:predicted dehydrogenase
VTHPVALLGLGAIGMGYDLSVQRVDRVCTHAKALALHGGFGPIIGIDPDSERRQSFQRAYGGPAYPDVREALRAHEPVAVVIAAPTGMHGELLDAVLDRSRPRLILCEKPLAEDLTVARRMVEVCEAKGVALYVNYMRRCDPAVCMVKRMLDLGEIESPTKGVVWYSKGLIHNGSHLVDLMRHWLGPIVSAHLIRRGRRWEDRDPEPDFLLDFARASVTFHAAWEERYSHYEADLLSQNGRLRYAQGGDRVEWQAVVDDPDFAGYRVLDRSLRRLPADMGRYQLNVVAELAAALEGRAALLCGGRDALQTLIDVHRIVDLL